MPNWLILGTQTDPGAGPVRSGRLPPGGVGGRGAPPLPIPRRDAEQPPAVSARTVRAVFGSARGLEIRRNDAPSRSTHSAGVRRTRIALLVPMRDLGDVVRVHRPVAAPRPPANPVPLRARRCIPRKLHRHHVRRRRPHVLRRAEHRGYGHWIGPLGLVAHSAKAAEKPAILDARRRAAPAGQTPCRQRADCERSAAPAGVTGDT